MTVKHNEFLVEYADEPTPREVRVRVIMADRLNVELRGRKFGLVDPTEQPQLTGFLWLYFAMIRQADIPDTTSFDEFRDRCLDNERLDEVEVPPTTEFDGSASDSPSASLTLIGSPPSNEETTD